MTSDDCQRLVPKGATVLVTGANGYLGSHVVEQFLDQGYKVRGTVRSLDSLSNLQKHWDDKYAGLFEGAEISDLTKKGAYGKAIERVSALVHTAADVTFANDFERIINGAIDSTLNALEAASSHPSIKRVVLTSSYICAAMPQVGQDGSHFDENDWNDQIVEIAKSVPKDHEMRGRFVYMSSKVQSEKRAFEWMREHKPSFVLNTVLPGFCFGDIIDPVKQRGSTAAITRDVFLMRGNKIAKTTPIQGFCSVTDIALLHVGAAVFEGFENKRLFGVAYIKTWNDILAIFRQLYPDKETYEDFDERRKEISHYDTTASLAVLKGFGKDGWKPIEEAIKENISKYA